MPTSAIYIYLKTSNFACGLNVTDTKSRNEKLSKIGRGLGHVTYFSNFGTPYYLWNSWTYKFESLHADWPKGYYTKKYKIGQKGTWPRSHDLLFKFCDLPNISGTAEDINLKFCTCITGSAVALHCCKAHSKINRKMGNSTPCKIVTPQKFQLETLHTWLRRGGYPPCQFWF